MILSTLFHQLTYHAATLKHGPAKHPKVGIRHSQPLKLAHERKQGVLLPKKACHPHQLQQKGAEWLSPILLFLSHGEKFEYLIAYPFEVAANRINVEIYAVGAHHWRLPSLRPK